MHASPRPPEWRRSSHSGGGNNCVETAVLPAGVGVRDSKNPEAGVLVVTSAQWRHLIEAVKAR